MTVLTTSRTAVTVVVPTFNEAGNVAPLVAGLREVLPADAGYEVLFVDDSNDDTPTEVRRAAHGAGVPVRLLHRPPHERSGGLGGAVMAGIRDTTAPVVVVMDGDLQHPPATVPELVGALEAGDGHDVAVASRYVGGGAADGLAGAARRAVSLGSTHLAKALFPRRLRHCTDPMTGFFALRTGAIRADDMAPMGFKILLEILARTPLRITEVPFTFAERFAGESKASLKQGLTFGWQLVNLRLGRPGRFAAVGASGVVVNLVAMALLLLLGTHYLVASVLATEVAIISNFWLQERFVFSDVAGRRGRRRRALQSGLFNNVEAFARLPLLALAVAGLGLHELTAQAVLILLGVTARFWFASRVVYKTTEVDAGSEIPVAEPPTSGEDLMPHNRLVDVVGPRPAHLDVVLPALDEELRLGDTLVALAAVLERAPFTSRVVVVDNGSVDGTADVVDAVCDEAFPVPVELISCARRGKGAAVRSGIAHTDARYVAYCDADLSTPPDLLLAGMSMLLDGHDAVIGSRRVAEAHIELAQPLVRRLGGRAFNQAARTLVGPLPDTQCGFKMLDGDIARDVFSHMRLDGYAFDVELIARLQRRGSRVAELPVTWSDEEGTRLRIATDGYRAFRDLLTVRRVLAEQGVRHG